MRTPHAASLCGVNGPAGGYPVYALIGSRTANSARCVVEILRAGCPEQTVRAQHAIAYACCSALLHTNSKRWYASCTQVSGSYVVSYYRVSTDRQRRSGLDIEAQRATVTRFAEAEGLAVVDEYGPANPRVRSPNRTSQELDCDSQLAGTRDLNKATRGVTFPLPAFLQDDCNTARRGAGFRGCLLRWFQKPGRCAGS